MKSLEKGLLKISCSVYKSNNFQRAAVDALRILFVSHQYNAFIISYLQLVIAHCPISYLAIYCNGRVKLSSAQ